MEGVEFDPHSGGVGGGSAERFAAASIDGTVRLFDTRAKTSCAKIKAHNCDVNEVTWNPLQGELLLSAADDGCCRVWDTRMVADGSRGSTSGVIDCADEALVYLHWHKKEITSVRWNPHDEATFAAASGDNSISIWDLSVEPDDDIERRKLPAEAANLPCQLMFHHLGQTEIKEVQWHPNIPGMLISTGAGGFHIFKPCNM